MTDPQEYEPVESFEPADPELTPEEIAAAEAALEANEEEQGTI